MMAPRFYLLIRLNKKGSKDPAILESFESEVRDHLNRLDCGTFSLAETASDEYRQRLRFECLHGKEALLSALEERCEAMRAAILEEQEKVGLTDEIEGVSLFATIGTVNWQAHDIHNADYPGWILEEYLNHIVYDAHTVAFVSGKESVSSRSWHGQPPIFIRPINDSLLERSRQIAREGYFRTFKNVAGNDFDEVAPLRITVPCKDVEQLVAIAGRAYEDVPLQNGVGGRSLLIGFCLERNSNVEGGKVAISNASAMGLRWQREPNGLVDHLLSGTLLVRRVTGTTRG
jgi:hypothetical protein